MEVIFSNEVKRALEEYRKSLKLYPISIDRAHEKYESMVNFLSELRNSITVPPLCTFKDLGQVFDANGTPQNQNLRRFNYKDKSGYQWAFGCLYNEETNKITIIKMLPSNQVKEEIEKQMMPIYEFMERLNAIK